MSVITKRMTITDTLLEHISASELPTWESRKRSEALASFEKQGIPTRRSESYKYSRVDLVLKDSFSLASAPHRVTIEQMRDLTVFDDTLRVVIENGKFNTSLSKLENLPAEITISSISDAMDSPHFKENYGICADVNSDPFIALNTVLNTGGVFIHIASKTVMTRPIHIVHVTSTTENTLVSPRNLIVVDAHAEAQLIESFEVVAGEAKVFDNALTEIVLKEHAILKHDKLQNEAQGNLVNATQVLQASNSTFTTNNVTLQGDFVRNNLQITLDGEHIETNLNGLYLPKMEQVVDNQTLVNHNKPNCVSNELYKGVISDNSIATFNGKIYVKKDAQKTNAFQSNKNILLSDNATINTKPQLEIYADDVLCSHGTTTGKIDNEHVFYLRSRGIGEESAKRLLLFAFANEVIERISFAPLKEFLITQIGE